MAHPIGKFPSCVVEFEEFRENLDACKEYWCAFPDIFFGGFPLREVLGWEGQRCSYRQEVPWGYVAECLLDEQARDDVLNESSFLADLVRRSVDEELSTKTETEFAKGSGSVKIFIGDEEVPYPSKGLGSAIDVGQCAVRRLP